MTAGKMIRSVQLQISYTDNRTGARTVDRTRAFYSVPAERQSDTTTGRAGSHGTYVNRRYVPVTEVVTTPEYVASVVDDIRQRMQQLIAAQDFLLQRAEQFRPALVAMMNELARDIEQAG